jgi:hypothetical protein
VVSQAIRARLDLASKDIIAISNVQRFIQLGNDPQFRGAFQDARDLWQEWLEVAKTLVDLTDDATILPLVGFVENVTQLINSGPTAPNETFATTIMKRTDALRKDLLPLRIAKLEHNSLTIRDVDELNLRKDTLRDEVEHIAAKATTDIKATLKEAEDGIKKKAESAVAEFEAAKAKSQKISIGDAQTQFSNAASSLRIKVVASSFLTAAFFTALIWLLLHFISHPPPLITSFVEAMKPGSKQALQPVPTAQFVAASAYFTSIRLALIAVLSVGLAFSLKLTRAYLHMVEHNQHKSRVTNSIEGFVASVRTDEQKDLVLGKLVDSVTQFGDSGILEKGDDKASGLSAVVLENITKNAREE